MKRIVVILVLLALAVGAALAFDVPSRLGWTSGAPQPLVLYGNIDIRQVQLGFRVGGRLAGIAVDEGAQVDAGDKLAQLDRRTFEDQRAAADAKLAAQKALLQKLEAGSRPAEISKARAAVAEREADLQNTQLALERAQQLKPSGATSQAALDQARATRDIARARTNAARDDLQLLELGARKEDIAAARANVREAEANVAAAETALADTELRSPARGVILSRVREPGAILQPGETVLTLSLVQPVWARAYIGETNLGRIHPGMQVEVYSDTAPDRAFKGTIGFISPVAEFTPKTVETPELRTALVYRFRVIIDEPGDTLRQGMPVTIRLPNGETS